MEGGGGEGAQERRKLQKRGQGKGGGYLVKIEDHMSILVSSLKATSLSLPEMISLADPTWRKHSTI